MNKYFYVLLISLLTILPTTYLCAKSISYIEDLEKNSQMTNAFDEFALKVESGTLTNQEIAKRLRAIARSEEKTSTGFGLLKLSYYYWAVAFLFIALFQGLIIRKIMKSSNIG